MRVLDASSDVHLGWRRIRLRGQGPERGPYPVAGWEPPLVGRRSFDLWSPKAAQQFNKAFANGDLGADLDLYVAEGCGPLALRVTEDDGAALPWEALPRLMKAPYRRRLAPLHVVDPDTAVGFSAVGAAMRCLILVGHPGADPAFDPATAMTFLETTVRAAMAANGHTPDALARQLRVETVDQVAAEIQAYAPNVVLYFGHGQQDDGPELRLSETEWMSLRPLADRLFAAAVERPPFWIFWACSLAEGADGPTARMGSPGTLDALSASGAVAILAMRARIGVGLARPMLDALIGAFASGEPLEVAAGYARAAALASEQSESGRMDDAAPTVWSRSAPVDEIRWGPGAGAPDAWAVVALLGGGGVTPEFETGVATTNVAAAELAASWAQPGRYFVSYPPGDDPAVRNQLLAAAAQLRRRDGRTVIPILLGAGKSFNQRLRAWGRSALESLDPRHVDRAVGGAIKAVCEDGVAGLPAILILPKVTVLLSEPPDRVEAWAVFDEAGPDATIVISGPAVPPKAATWTLDQLMPNAPPDAPLAQAIATAPLACAVLGVTERALRFDDVARVAEVKREDLQGLESYCVRVDARRMLGQRTRGEILKVLDAQVVAKARSLCIDLLSFQNLDLDFEALTETCSQYLALSAAPKAAQAINAAWEYIGARWTNTQRLRLFNLIALSQALRDDLEDPVILDLSRAAIETQDTHWAKPILERLRPRELQDQGRRYALLSECFKADVETPAAREAMFANARKAVETAEALGVPLAASHQRVNLARLRQYFDHDYAAALTVYTDVLKNLGDPPTVDASSAQLFAAASRNGAECLLDPAPRPIDLKLRDQIDLILQRGATAAEAYGLFETLGDLRYTQARLAEAAGDDVAAADVLQGLAHPPYAAGYGLLAAISADRLYWNEIRQGKRPFERAEFQRLNQRLDLFEHGWAVRVALKARLRAVRQLLARGAAGDLEAAKALIVENQDRIGRNPGLRGHEDARSAGLTEAIADVVAQPPTTRWQQFLAGPRAALLPPEWAGRTATQVWNEAI